MMSDKLKALDVLMQEDEYKGLHSNPYSNCVEEETIIIYKYTDGWYWSFYDDRAGELVSAAGGPFDTSSEAYYGSPILGVHLGQRN